MKRYLLQSVATVAILLGAGCSAPSTTNDQTGTENIVDNGLSAEQMGADANVQSTVAIAAPPQAPAGSSADDTAPLAQATEIATEIDSAPDVERVPFEGGWAWRRHGQVVRTASRDGRRVSYFRPGESAPFFVQQGEDSFAYSGGQARRSYDRGGHAQPISQAGRADAQRLADESRRDRVQAQHAPTPPAQADAGRDRAGSRDRTDRERGGGPSEATTNSTTSGRSPDRDRNAGTDRRRDRRSNDDSTNRVGSRDR